MKYKILFPGAGFVKMMAILCFAVLTETAFSQIPPPGYEREMKMMEERAKMHPLDSDSVMVVDTAIIFDPNTSESEVIITHTNYSLRDYCLRFLGVSNPEMLMDGKPHTIIDPKTYDDMIIRLNSSGKIDTIPK